MKTGTENDREGSGDSRPKGSGPAGSGTSDRARPAGRGKRRGATGIGGSDSERRAGAALAGELEATGRIVEVREARVRPGEGITLLAHAVLAVAGSMIGLLSPIIGAALVLLAMFSFYGERGLGLLLLGRALPKRRIRNLISPPLGPAWEKEVDVILAAGYDAPPSYPVGAWLARRLGGRLTTDRLLFWAGMTPTFLALMLALAGKDGTWVQLIQIFGTAIMLAVIAAQADRFLKGETIGEERDLEAARDLIKVVSNIQDDGDLGEVGVAICLFGAESDGAAGAEAFYTDRRLKVKDDITVIGLVTAAGDPPEATVAEGDLTRVKMTRSLVDQLRRRPAEVTIRRDTAAGLAARRGARAITLVGRGENGLDLVFETLAKIDSKEDQ